MAADLSQFVAGFLGTSHVGTTVDNVGQCVGLVEAWMAANGWPAVWGNAVDLLENAPKPPYRVELNTPTNWPPSGAAVVWNANWGGGFGHTAIVLVANAISLVVFEQNDPVGSACVVSTHDYGDVVGWLLPVSAD